MPAIGEGHLTALRGAAPLLAALVLAAGALLTVHRAGCDDPGRYVPLAAGGYELIGGCLAPGDLVVPDPAPAPDAEAGAPARS